VISGSGLGAAAARARRDSSASARRSHAHGCDANSRRGPPPGASRHRAITNPADEPDHKHAERLKRRLREARRQQGQQTRKRNGNLTHGGDPPAGQATEKRANAPRPMDLSPTGFGVAATIACSAPQTTPASGHPPAITPPLSTSRIPKLEIELNTEDDQPHSPNGIEQFRHSAHQLERDIWCLRRAEVRGVQRLLTHRQRTIADGSPAGANGHCVCDRPSSIRPAEWCQRCPSLSQSGNDDRRVAPVRYGSTIGCSGRSLKALGAGGPAVSLANGGFRRSSQQ
jgi:hypothetical protein